MVAPTFDALEYYEKLKENGVPDAQARTQAEMLQRQAEFIKANMEERLAEIRADIEKSINDSYELKKGELATKDDIAALRSDMASLKVDVAEARAFLRIELEVSRKDFDNKLTNQKFEILKWIVGLLFAQTALLVALMSYLRP